MKILDVIVVEGRNDISAVKASVCAEVIATGGSHISEEFKNNLKELSKRKGIIIFTDPDYTGEKIRTELKKLIPQAKHAYLSQDQSRKKGDIGIENARPEDIRKALQNSRAEVGQAGENFKKSDLIKYGLTACPQSKARRIKLGKALNIGYQNSKQLVNKLSSFGISREEFEKAARTILEEEKNYE